MNGAAPGAGTLPQDPVFIVGYPRSGTTLLQALLAAVPGFYSFPETHFFTVIRKAIPLDRQGETDCSRLPELFESVTEKAGCSFTAGERRGIEEECRSGDLTEKGLFEHLVGTLLRGRFGDRLFDGPFRWVEKTPNHAYFLEDIAALYPGGSFVNIVRHPIAAVASRKKSLQPGRQWSPGELADLWVRSVEAAETFDRRHPGKLHSLRYEDLTADPLGEMAKVARHLGTEYREDYLRDYRSRSHSLIHSWETWKTDVADREIFDGNSSRLRELPLMETLEIQNRAGAVMERYRYPLSRRLAQALFNAGVGVKG